MQRYAVLDGLRGYFLVFMLINHLAFAGGSLLARINHSELGFVQDAQGFVFISGMIVGLYYTRLLRDGRAQLVGAKIVKRAADLYLYALAVMALVVGAAIWFPESQEFWGDRLIHVYDDAGLHGASAALLVYQPTYMDILPQYIVYLLASPVLLRLIAAGRWRLVAAGSTALWLAVQFGWHLPLVASIEGAVQGVAPEFLMRAHFNPLAWQIVFVSGLLLGAAEARGELDRWFAPDRPALFGVALALLLVFMAYRLGFTFELLPTELADRFHQLENRGEFSIPFLLNFAALAYVVAWLLLCGRRSAAPAARAAGQALHWVFRRPFLVFIGKHSLQVYAYHVVLAYGVLAVDWHYGPWPEPAKGAITFVAVASLALPALVHQRWTARPRPALRPAVAARPPAAAQGDIATLRG